MLPQEIIRRKREGEALAADEIAAMVKGLTDGTVSEGQVAAFAMEHAADEAMQPFAAPLSTALGHLQQATTWLMQNAMAKPDNAGAGATDWRWRCR